jgi:hypothetical protein
LSYEKLAQLLGHLVTIMDKVGLDVISPQELRTILRDVAKLPLEKEALNEPEEEEEESLA